MRILLTGVAGFIGNALAARLLARGDEVIGVDNLNDYYDVQLKRDRLARLAGFDRFVNLTLDIADDVRMSELFRKYAPQRVAHLAAQAGVRYSLSNPHQYASSNLNGFLNVLEGCRHHRVEHLVYASSSSVYGANTRVPYSVNDNVDHPLSLYAATKKSNELMAHTYSHLFALPVTGLRFFTVYGPWGRPDMSPILFARRIMAGEALDVYNFGNHRRDFTYIDDIVEGVVRTLDHVATADPNWCSDRPEPATSSAPYRLYNIGGNDPVELLHFIELLERGLGRTARKNLLPMQPGDMPSTYADVDSLVTDVGYRPTTRLEDGVAQFVRWFLDYYPR